MIKSKKAIKPIAIACTILVLLGLLAGFVAYSFMDNKVSRDVSLSEAQQYVDKTFKSLPKVTAKGSKAVLAQTEIKVLDVKKGTERNFVLECEYSTLDAGAVISANKQALVDAAYLLTYNAEQEGKKLNATKICQGIAPDFEAVLAGAEKKSGKITLYLYEVSEGKFSIWLSDEAVDACMGGLVTAAKEIDKIKTASLAGREIDIANSNTIRSGVKDYIALSNYDSEKPITGNFVVRWVNDFKYDFNRNFLENGRWHYLLEGLGTTLAITGCAGLIGVLLGFIIAIIRCTAQTTGKLKFVDAVCRFYLTVIRGTPVMVQLLIIYFVLLLPIGVPKFTAAVICFGLNSGAYVAEIVRGGIMSVDKGQNEAGRSLGFNFPQTMWHFIVPQAFKAVLPALANEFITLLKESSVAFYIGVADLTQGGLKIRSITYSNFMPLIAVALIYLIIVLILTRLVGILERRLRKSDH